MSRPSSEAGFSVIEALVALAVFAMAGVGLVQLQTHSLQSFARVEARALAGALAQNRLVELAAATTAPALGVEEGDVIYANRSWRWRSEIATTPDPAVLRASVSVFDAGTGAPAAQAVAFIPSPTGARP